MVSPARAELAATQAALARALLEDGPVPPGFDAERVHALKDSLAHKRAHAAADAWPALKRQLGVHFGPLFAEHVAPLRLGASLGPLLDGWRLAEVLEQERRLDGPSTSALASYRLRYRKDGDVLLPRDGATFSLARAESGVAIAVRWPGLFQHIFWWKSR